MLITKKKSVECRNENYIHALVDEDTGSITELNETAYQIWSLLDNNDSVKRIAEELSATYGANIEDVKKDVEEVVFGLISRGMLVTNRNAVYIPYSTWKHRSDYVVYFPTERISLLANEAFVKELNKSSAHSLRQLQSLDIESDFREILGSLGILNKPFTRYDYERQEPYLPRRAVLMPTTDCNMDCSYCYAGDPGKKKYYMNKEIAKAAVDYVVENSLELGVRSVDLSFMGGGEPTVNWSVLTYSVTYAQERAKALLAPVSTTLTTNGILNDPQIEWIADNIDFIKVSFDGTKDIQNTQRPLRREDSFRGDSFSVVTHTLKKLSDLRCKFLVRCTVTNSSMNRLRDSVSYILDNFMPNSIIINPIYVCGSCASHGIGSIDHRIFCKEFEVVQDMGNKYNVDIITPYDKLTYMEIPKTPFCGFEKGNCFVTPDGYLSACSEIDSADDIRSTVFFFGKWNPRIGKIVANKVKLQQLHEIGTYPLAMCNSCKSCAFCSGHCLVRKISVETMDILSSTRRNVDPTKELSNEEIEILCSGCPSIESNTQCAMTNQLSKIQAIRALEKNDSLDGLSVKFRKHSPEGIPLSRGNYTVHKLVSISLLNGE